MPDTVDLAAVAPTLHALIRRADGSVAVNPADRDPWSSHGIAMDHVRALVAAGLMVIDTATTRDRARTVPAWRLTADAVMAADALDLLSADDVDACNDGTVTLV